MAISTGEARGHTPSDHDQTPSVQTSFAMDVRALVSVMEELGNAFKKESMDLIIIHTK